MSHSAQWAILTRRLWRRNQRLDTDPRDRVEAAHRCIRAQTWY